MWPQHYLILTLSEIIFVYFPGLCSNTHYIFQQKYTFSKMSKYSLFIFTVSSKFFNFFYKLLKTKVFNKNTHFFKISDCSSFFIKIFLISLIFFVFSQIHCILSKTKLFEKIHFFQKSMTIHTFYTFHQNL